MDPEWFSRWYFFFILIWGNAYIFLERRAGRERERERNIELRKKHWPGASPLLPDQLGTKSYLRHVPWLGIKPMTLRSPGCCCRQLSHTDQGSQHSKTTVVPWLVGLHGPNAGLWTKRSLVQFPVRACAWVSGQVRGSEHVRDNRLMFLSLSFF